MKPLSLFLLTLGAALSAHAGPGTFIKVGESYALHGATIGYATVIVRAEQGDGWYACEAPGSGAMSWINFNELAEIRLADGPLPTVPMPAREIRRQVELYLRQLRAAAQMYYLEHNAAETTLAELVGPTKEVKRLIPVDGEDYSTLVFRQGAALVIRTKSGIEVRLEP